MRLAFKLPCFLIILGIFTVLSSKGNAAPKEKSKELTRGLETRSAGLNTPPDRPWQNVTLDPFFILRGEKGKVWVERIIVVLQITVERVSPKLDVTGPSIRTALYDLFRSGQPETNIKKQALASLNQQAKRKAVTTMNISRSILIVR